MEVLGHFGYKIISSANRDNLTSSLPISIPFISFFYFIVLVGISVLYLVRVGRVDTFVLLLTLEEMVSVFPHLV
jgi:hypothetical protein